MQPFNDRSYSLVLRSARSEAANRNIKFGSMNMKSHICLTISIWKIEAKRVINHGIA